MSLVSCASPWLLSWHQSQRHMTWARWILVLLGHKLEKHTVRVYSWTWFLSISNLPPKNMIMVTSNGRMRIKTAIVTQTCQVRGFTKAVQFGASDGFYSGKEGSFRSSRISHESIFPPEWGASNESPWWGQGNQPLRPSWKWLWSQRQPHLTHC